MTEASEAEVLVSLRQILTERFNDDELRSLCFDLGVDYDNLGGEGKAGKARELVAYLERRGDIPKLVEAVRQARPGISWDELPSGAAVSLPGSQAAPRLLRDQRRSAIVLVGVIVLGVVIVVLVRMLILAGLPGVLSSSPGPAATPVRVPTTASAPAPPASPTAPLSATSTPAPTEAPTRTVAATPTEAPKPEFMVRLPLNFGEPVGVQMEKNAPYADMRDLLNLREVWLGQFQSDGPTGFQITMGVSNPTSDTIRLALEPGFFSMEDKLGRTVAPIYFCCAKSLDLLAPGQEREVLLLFPDPNHWATPSKGSSIGVSVVVRGLLPVIHAAWPLYMPKVAD